MDAVDFVDIDRKVRGKGIEENDPLSLSYFSLPPIIVSTLECFEFLST